MLNVQNADVYTDFSGLAQLKNKARQESPEALKEVAKQFESLFLKIMEMSMIYTSLKCLFVKMALQKILPTTCY